MLAIVNNAAVNTGVHVSLITTFNFNTSFVPGNVLLVLSI